MRFSNCAIYSIVILLTGCVNRNKETSDDIRSSSAISIRKVFPDAVPFNDYTDSLLFFLYTVHNIAEEKVLLGQSACTDDVINTKDFFTNHKVKGPFNLGGLAGLPFTGITGYNAFTHHVPDGGAALLFIGPHIGFSKKDGWGKIEREGQSESSACCGAIVAALEKLKRQGGIVKKVPGDNDYQEEVIEQLALEHRDEILNSDKPLVTLTKLIYKEAERRIDNISLKVSNFRYQILVVGVIINTDLNDPDYLWVDHMKIFDLEKEREIRGMEK